jgi:hypothetical protein
VLVTLGLETLLRAGTSTVWRGLFGESIFDSAEIRFVVGPLTRSSISSIGAGLFLTAAVRVRAGLPWKVFLGGQAAHASATGLGWAVTAFIPSWWPQLAWMHWLGVITVLAAIFMRIAWIVILQFI